MIELLLIEQKLVSNPTYYKDLDYRGDVYRFIDEFAEDNMGEIQHNYLKPILSRRQNNTCPHCNKTLKQDRQLHHAILRRSDIRGWKDWERRARVIFEPRNCIVLCPPCHQYLDAKKLECWQILEKYYDREVMVEWYESMRGLFKSGLPNRVEYFLP